MYPHKIYKLDNNLKIITLPNKTTSLVILTIAMKLGNDIETREILEIGHFIEHLFSMFTSSKYPDGKKNREELSFRNIDLDAHIVNKEIKFNLNFLSLFNLFKKVLRIKILSSLDGIFSLRIFKVFFLFLLRQLSTNSPAL